MKFREKVMCNVILADLAKVIEAEDDFLKNLKFNNVKNKASEMMFKKKIPSDFYFDIFATGRENYWEAENFSYGMLKWYCEANSADREAKKMLATMKAEKGIE